MPKRILITGAGGFIGYELGRFLAGSGHTVIGVDLKYPKEAIGPFFHEHRLDFRESERLGLLMEGVDVVFHLASAHLEINLDESAYWDVNVSSLPTLMELARWSGVGRFVHVSSVGVYGNLTHRRADENTPCEPQSIYGKSKLAGEEQVKEFGRQNQLPYVIIRPSWVYGSACPRLIKLCKALRSKRFVMIGTGENMRHPIYIKDLLDAFGLAMENERAVGEVFVIGGEAPITSREVMTTVCDVFGLQEPSIRIPYRLGGMLAAGAESVFKLIRKEPPISRRTLEFFHTNNAFDISKAKSMLGFEPKFSFVQGLMECRSEIEGMN